MRAYFWIATILCLLSITFHLTDRLFWQPAEEALVKVYEMEQIVEELQAAARQDSILIQWQSEHHGILESFWLQSLGRSWSGIRIGMRYTACREKIDHKYLRRKGFEGFER